MTFSSASISPLALMGILMSIPLFANSQPIERKAFCNAYIPYATRHYDAVYDLWTRNPAQRDNTAATAFWEVHATAGDCTTILRLAVEMRKMGYDRPLDVKPFVLQVYATSKTGPGADAQMHIKNDLDR